jgi:hypothetical protein
MTPAQRPAAGRGGAERPGFVRIVAWLCGFAATIACPAALAMMAGAEPDTPADRVDPNFAASAWASVGSVVVKGSPYSGVLITRRHVLTAAHVAGGDAAQVEFVLNAGGDASQRIAAKSIHRHPDWKGFDPKHPNDDLAIIELAEPAAADIAIHPVAAGTWPAGLEFTAVGYGGSGHGDTGATIGASATVKRVGRNNADAFVQDRGGKGRVEGFLFDFDGPGARNALGGEGLGNDIETTFAAGDSGSPSFVRTPSGWALFGINTFIFTFPDGPARASTFGTGGGGVVVGAYREWIGQVLRATAPERGGAWPRWIPLARTGARARSARESDPAEAVRRIRAAGLHPDLSHESP